MLLNINVINWYAKWLTINHLRMVLKLYKTYVKTNSFRNIQILQMWSVFRKHCVAWNGKNVLFQITTKFVKNIIGIAGISILDQNKCSLQFFFVYFSNKFGSNSFFWCLKKKKSSIKSRYKETKDGIIFCPQKFFTYLDGMKKNKVNFIDGE